MARPATTATHRQQNDACTGGVCSGTPVSPCNALDACHLAGTPESTTGRCTNPLAPDGTTCGPATVCAAASTCLAGVCKPGAPVPIDDGNPCTLDTCDPDAGIVHHACSTLNRSTSTVFPTSTAFLYSGANPVQTGVAPGTIVPTTQAVVRGEVYGRDGSALPGVTVTVAGHPEFGSTVTQSDGHFDMAVNGGGTLRMHYALANFLPAERIVQTPWQDYVMAGDVALTQLDPQVTSVDVSTSSTTQVVRGTVSSDSSGTRQATVLVPAGTTATMTMPDGSTTVPTALHVRATEYTVGTIGPTAMPAESAADQ